ncbi:MAG: ABC transporter ATP-binding protein [archaeon]|nr:ABC transporter ATP-binding protein [archaeon]
MSTTIEVNNLVKVFYDKKHDRNLHAVDGISLKINSGEIFGFLGPNGAGKTTTIRVLAGLLKPTAGTARVFGKDVTEIGDRIRKDIGFLTENHGNYENLTVYENLNFFGGFFDIDNLEQKIYDILEKLELSDRVNMKVGKLSKGLKQRTALARVLLPNPKIIFLDEPTAGLDPKAAANVRELIKGLKSKDRIIFINSHNLDEVQKVCDRVAILNSGKIMRIGTASELSEDLFGTQELIIKIKNTFSPEILGLINNLEYVENSRLEKTDKQELYLLLKDTEIFTPEIVKILVEHGLKILEVKRMDHSLEDIYLTLMEEPEKLEDDKDEKEDK